MQAQLDVSPLGLVKQRDGRGSSDLSFTLTDLITYKREDLPC